MFDDSAASAISAGMAPFAGTFCPDSLLSALNGKASNGTWKLRVSDNASMDTGTIFCFQLEITARPRVCCPFTDGTPNIIAVPPATVTAESCTPANNAPDPDETVTMSFPLQNNGTGITDNLVATLLPGGGVHSPSGPQNYGVVSPIGPPVSRPFSFAVSGMCGGDITATLQLQDGATDLGTATFTIRIGGTVTNTAGPFANPATITIPSSGAASPYPSTINVSGVTDTVSKVTATLVNINHTFPDDIDVLLVGPGGQNVLLMSDAGGDPDLVNVTLTFDDMGSALPDSTQIASGTYRPTNFGTGDTFPATAPASPFGSALSVFNGVDPNGMWQLFVSDDAAGDFGNIAGGWSLSITTEVPVCCDSACTLTCPADQAQSNDPGQCGAVVNYASPTVGGSCGVVVCTPPSGSFFPVGTTAVTCTATTQSGDTTMCSFNVMVQDTEAPTITCPADILAIAANPGAICVPVNFNVTATDNCPGVTIQCVESVGGQVISQPTPNNFSFCFPLSNALTTVTCTATDGGGNTAQCSFKVLVFDVFLEDDSRKTTSELVWNSRTGDYIFCCEGVAICGKGKTNVRGSIFSLEDFSAGRRVSGSLSSLRGSATFQAAGVNCKIQERDIRDNVPDCVKVAPCAFGGGS